MSYHEACVKKYVSLTLLLSNLPQTLNKSKGVIMGTVTALLEVSYMLHHGLVAFLLLVEGLSHLQKPLIQLRHAHSPHHQPSNPSHSLCI